MERIRLRNPWSLIKESIQLLCPLCYVQYDDAQKLPMIICINQHSVCLKCLNDLFVLMAQRECPFCKIKITRDKATKFRLLHQIRMTASILRAQGSKVRVAIQGLSQDNGQLQQEVLREKEKNKFLIINTIQKQALAEFKFQEALAKQKREYQSKIQALEKQLDLFRKKQEQEEKIKGICTLSVELPPNQTRLDCNRRDILLKNNNLTSIDLSQSPNLIQLDLNWNKLTQLDLLNNPNITYINLYDNHLTSLFIRYSERLSVRNISLGNQHSEKCTIELHYRKIDKEKCSRLKKELESQFDGEKGADYKKHINAYSCQYDFQMKEY